MSEKVNVAIVGATGAVGEALIEILEQRDFPVGQLYLLASERSAGTTLMFRNKPIMVTDLTEFDFSKAQIGLFSAGGSISEVYAPKAAAAGCVVIDNTSHFRYDDDIPLVVPEVNPEAIAGYTTRNIIANPNCSTIQMLVALKPIHDAVGIKRISVATYQAVSGTDGWPVLIQLAIIPFAAVGEAPYTPNGTTPKCGMDGLLEPTFPWANVDMAAVGGGAPRAVKRRRRYQRSSLGTENPARELVPLPPPGPPTPPSYWQCMGSMAQVVGEAAYLRSPEMSAAQTEYCLEAVNATRYFPQPNGSGYEKVWVLSLLLDRGGCTMEMITRGCSPPAKKCGRLSFLSSDSAVCASLAANCSATGGADECTSQPCPSPGPCQLCEGYCAQPGPDPESDLMERLNCSFTTVKHA